MTQVKAAAQQASLAQAAMEAPKRNVATNIFLVFERNSVPRIRDVVKFDTKPELDAWLADHDVTPISVIRGREKLFKTKVVFA